MEVLGDDRAFLLGQNPHNGREEVKMIKNQMGKIFKFDGIIFI